MFLQISQIDEKDYCSNNRYEFMTPCALIDNQINNKDCDYAAMVIAPIFLFISIF